MRQCGSTTWKGTDLQQRTEEGEECPSPPAWLRLHLTIPGTLFLSPLPATPGTELPLKGTVVFGMALSFYSLNPTEKHEPSNRHRQAHHRFCPAWSSVLGLVSRGTIKNTFQMVKNLEQGLKEQAPRYNLESCPNLCLIDGSYTLLFSLGLHVNSVVT